MPTAQGVELRGSASGGDSAHAPARPVVCNRPIRRFGVIFCALTLSLAAGLRAQGRGDLQVGAQVLMAAPSQAALALALNHPAAASRGALAEISRSRQPAVLDSAGVALPPRSIITIAFLHN